MPKSCLLFSMILKFLIRTTTNKSDDKVHISLSYWCTRLLRWPRVGPQYKRSFIIHKKKYWLSNLTVHDQGPSATYRATESISSLAIINNTHHEVEPTHLLPPVSLLRRAAATTVVVAAATMKAFAPSRGVVRGGGCETHRVTPFRGVTPRQK